MFSNTYLNVIIYKNSPVTSPYENRRYLKHNIFLEALFTNFVTYLIERVRPSISKNYTFLNFPVLIIPGNTTKTERKTFVEEGGGFRPLYSIVHCQVQSFLKSYCSLL